INNAVNHIRVAHTGDTTLGTDVRRDTLQRHDRTGSRILRDFCMFGGDDIHNDAALEHLCQTALYSFGSSLLISVGMGSICGHSQSSLTLWSIHVLFVMLG